MTDLGASSDEDRAGRASPEPASSLGHTATIPCARGRRSRTLGARSIASHIRDHQGDPDLAFIIEWLCDMADDGEVYREAFKWFRNYPEFIPNRERVAEWDRDVTAARELYEAEQSDPDALTGCADDQFWTGVPAEAMRDWLSDSDTRPEDGDAKQGSTRE